MACQKKWRRKKTFTLYVSYECISLSVLTLIVEKSMNWLGTTKPLITLADYKLEMFTPLINKYNLELTEKITGAYNDRSKELCFNKILTSKQDII